MPDYDLTGLSPRSFEQLIQAIALQEISSQTIIFGDGTDGGREASFYGKTQYPNEVTAWDGYIVFQAKFRQRPDKDTTKDGNWAVAQLKKELDDFADSEKGRKIPDYYIFATNVILTPMLDKGSKDKAYKLFEDNLDTVPLKGYDIWDYDKIARFLDNYPGIRQTYAAWITPGDVLATVIKDIKHIQGLNRPDFESVITNFLQKELLSDLYANLEQAGHSNDDKIPLASVFVDLPFAKGRILEPSRNEDESFIVAQLIKSARQKLDPKSLIDNKNFAPGSNLMLEMQKRKIIGQWVIIGGPGQGKTTVGQFLCQLFRVAILKDRTNNNYQVINALSDFKSQCEKENIKCPIVRRFPIRIVLNDFAAKLASQETTSLLDYITQKIRKRTNREIVVDDLRLWLATYPWLIILDGLDEVPASSNRMEVLDAVRDFWVDANDENADIMVVATTRPQGYSDDFGTDLYNHVWLTPLSKERALHYSHRLVELRYGDDRKETIISRLKRAVEDNSTSRLMQSPLQVTIMTVLLNKTGQAPKDRWNLFHKYYEIIYDREVERDIPASVILQNYRADIDDIHHQVGLLLQVQSEHSGKTDARLSVKDFTTLVRARLEEEGHEGKECESLTNQIIEAAANRLVFLVGLEQDIVGFEIRSLQEFMASEAIMNGSDQQINQRLEEIIPIISWRNVVLFAIGNCFTRKQYLRNDIYTSCAALNDLDDFYHATLAGSRLALDILEDGAIAQQPKYLKLFTRLALNLLDLSPANYHIQLANVYVESLENIYKEEIEKRISNQNYEQYLGAWTCLLQLINLGFEWAIDLADKYWTHDEEEQIKTFYCFLHLDINIIDSQKWIAKQINYILPRISPVVANKYLPLYKDIVPKLEINDYCQEIFALFESSITDEIAEEFIYNYDYFPQVQDKTSINDIWSLYYIPSILLGETIEDSDGLLCTPDFLNKIKAIPGISYYWIAYKYAIDFWLNPSKELLSRVIRYIAEHYDNDLINWIIKLVPWQIYECLLTSQNPQELLEIADLAYKGELGERKDWLKAEERWNSLGIIEQDFFYNPDLGIPFNSNIAKVGFPIKMNPWIMYHGGNKNNYSQNSISLLTNLLDLYPQINYQSALKTISDIIIRLLYENRVNQEFIQNNQYKNYNVIKKAIHQNTQLYSYQVRQETIENIISMYKINHDTDLIDLIDTIGNKNSFEYHISLGKYDKQIELYEQLVIYFNNNHKSIGIMIILSYLYPNLEIIKLLSTINCKLLELDRFTNYKDRETAIILLLTQEKWLESNLDEVINYGMDLINYSRIISRIVIMIENKLFSESISKKILQKLQKHLYQFNWEQLSRINNLINDRIANQTSKLVNTNTWNKLGLPQGASSLLPE